MRRAAEQGIQVAVERALPVGRYVRLAVDYANLKALDAEALRPLCLRAHGLDGTVHRTAGGHTVSVGLFPRTFKMMTKVAARSRTQAWIKEVLALAADDKPLPRDYEHELIDTFRGQSVSLDLQFHAGRLGAQIHVPDADFMWFLSLGLAALFDKQGSYYKAIRRCDNFAGSTYAKLPSTACGNYMLKISDGGRKPARFCSPECRNRVNQREKPRKSPYRE